MKIKNQEFYNDLEDCELGKDEINTKKKAMNTKNKSKLIDEEKVEKCLNDMKIKNNELFDNIKDCSIDQDIMNKKNKSKRIDEEKI